MSLRQADQLSLRRQSEGVTMTPTGQAACLPTAWAWRSGQLRGRVGLLVILWELAKPRLLALALLVVACGGFLGSLFGGDIALLPAVLVGTAFVALAGMIWNQCLERDIDRLMERTCRRPLPSGRLSLRSAWWLGAVALCAGAGTYATTGRYLAMALSLFCIALYVGVYTPLKRRATIHTAIGAVAGAMPPLIGWAGVNDALSPLAWSLFGVLFLWQFPHFFAISWLWRDEYARAGLRVLAAQDQTGTATGRQSLAYALALIPVSLLPAAEGYASAIYFLGALLLGMSLAGCAAEFWWKPSERTSRQLLKGSIWYLAALVVLLSLDVWSHR
jgi:protoheme IX farnesyltransferase